MQLFAQFDSISWVLLQGFVRKVVLFAAFAAFISVLQTNGLAMTGIVLQKECLVGGGFSIILAIIARQRFDAETLTYWDEAVAFSGVGMMGHIATSLI